MSFRIVKDTVKQGLDALKHRLVQANGRQVKVGVPEGKAGNTESSLADVAKWNEFGTEDIPERPAFRNGIAKAKTKILALNKRNLLLIAKDEMSVEQALDMLGALATGEIKREFVSGEFAPNAPSTIAKKGSSRPLIDSGQLRQSITWEVV